MEEKEIKESLYYLDKERKELEEKVFVVTRKINKLVIELRNNYQKEFECFKEPDKR